MAAAKKPVCAVCGKPRGLTVPKTLSKDGRARLLEMLLEDDFCSAKCAREAHGVDQPERTDSEKAQTERAARETDAKWEAA